MTPNYGFGSIDWSTIATDPYFLQLQKNNIAFQAQAQAAAQASQAAQVTTPQAVTNPGIDYATAEPESSNAGLWITGAVGAGTLIYAMAKGKGNPIKGFKAIFGKITKTTSGAQDKLKQLTAIRNSDGTYSYLVPGEVKKYSAPDEIERIAKEYGIDLRQLKSLKSGTSKLEGGVFKYKDKDGKVFEISFANNKITKIHDGKDDVSTLWLGKDAKLNDKDKEFLAELQEYITKAQNMEKSWAKDFTTYNVTREIGDNAATIVYTKGGKPEITSLTTLARLNKDDKAVRAWLQNHQSEKEIFTNKDFLKDGKIPEGAKIPFAEIPYKGNICRFENGEFKGITAGGKYYAKGTKDCDSFLLDETENLTKLYNNFLKGKLPRGTDSSLLKVQIVV